MTTPMDDIAYLIVGDVAGTEDAPPPRVVPGRRPGRPLGSKNAKPGAVPVPKVPKPEPPQLPAVAKDAISQLYVFAGMGLTPFKPTVGVALANSADDCAKAWMELAKTNPAVRRAILSMLQTSAWGGLAIAHLPILYALMQPNPAGVKEVTPVDRETPVQPRSAPRRVRPGTASAVE
jgi:hypothetical protein